MVGFLLTAAALGSLWYSNSYSFGAKSSITTSETINTLYALVNDLANLASNFSTTTANAFNTTSTTTFAGGLYAKRIAAPYFNATSTTATSTFRNGLSITSGCLDINGVCITSVAVPVSILNGGLATSTAGVTNSILYYNGTHYTSDYEFAYNGTNLSIGTSTFGALLNIGGYGNFYNGATSTIYGPTQFRGSQLALNFASSTSAATVQTINWNNGASQRFILSDNTTLVLNSTSSNPLDGGRYIIKVCQDSTGGRTVNLAPANLLNYSMGTPTPPTTGLKGFMYGMVYDGRVSRYDVVAATSTPYPSCLP